MSVARHGNSKTGRLPKVPRHPVLGNAQQNRDSSGRRFRLHRQSARVILGGIRFTSRAGTRSSPRKPTRSITLAFGLSPACRLAVIFRGATATKWIVESLQPFWRRRESSLAKTSSLQPANGPSRRAAPVFRQHSTRFIPDRDAEATWRRSPSEYAGLRRRRRYCACGTPAGGTGDLANSGERRGSQPAQYSAFARMQNPVSANHTIATPTKPVNASHHGL